MTFLNYINDETLHEIKNSLENLRQQTMQLSDFFRYSLVLILKWKRLLRAGRIRCVESGTPSTMISVRDAAVVITDLSIMFPCCK